MNTIINIDRLIQRYLYMYTEVVNCFCLTLLNRANDPKEIPHDIFTCKYVCYTRHLEHVLRNVY